MITFIQGDIITIEDGPHEKSSLYLNPVLELNLKKSDTYSAQIRSSCNESMKQVFNKINVARTDSEKIWYLSLEEEDAVNYDFLSDCCELEDLFIYSEENIKLPDLSKLEKLSQVSILSSKQQNFDGLETIPCTFSFYIAEPSDVIMMNDVDYTALTNSNCNRIGIDFRYNQKYSQIPNFVSFIEKMKNKGNFYLDIIE